MNHKKYLRKRYSETISVRSEKFCGGNQFLFWPMSVLGISDMCSAQANARDVCKIKMIVHRARIGSTLPKLIGVGVENCPPRFLSVRGHQAFCGIGMVVPMTAIASRQENQFGTELQRAVPP